MPVNIENNYEREITNNEKQLVNWVEKTIISFLAANINHNAWKPTAVWDAFMQFTVESRETFKIIHWMRARMFFLFKIGKVFLNKHEITINNTIQNKNKYIFEDIAGFKTL